MIVSSGVAPPFSVIHASDKTGDEVLLWSPSYEESKNVDFSDGGFAYKLPLIETEYGPNETITQEYYIKKNSLETGNYSFESDFDYLHFEGNYTTNPNKTLVRRNKSVNGTLRLDVNFSIT